MRQFGRDDLKNVASMLPDKKLAEVTAYYHAFWSRGKAELRDFDKYVALISKAEAERAKQSAFGEAFHWKMSSYRCPELELTLKSHNNKSQFTAEQDNIILCYLFKIGIDEPNAYDRIRHTIQ